MWDESKSGRGVTEMASEMLNWALSNIKPYHEEKTDDSGNNFGISKILHLQVETENYGTLYYKTSFDEKEFTTINLIWSGRRTTFPKEISNLRSDANAISTKEYKHLQTLLKWVPRQFHDFYKNLKYSSECGVNDDDEYYSNCRNCK
ncbi:hypothetical protein ILUMI_17306 [Ignelater luminosus]|uniref:Uncharacterized protein n=1 Tax=Ignelater luminosus TaxID=2038154 RepID=A0A8K0G562_IGNLU|nr:hypothetical protein ILUMI_17306 [Ignelater luminosus]